MDNVRHYHVVGVCREHGAQEVGIFRTKEEALKFIFSSPETLRGPNNDVDIEVIGRTDNIIEFVQTRNGETHEQFITFGTHDGDADLFEVCHAAFMMKSMMEMMMRGMPRDEQDAPAAAQEDVNVDSSALFDDISNWLNGDQPNA